MRVGLMVFEGVDLLDVGGPYEVFLTASRLAERGGDPPPFAVATVAAGRGASGAGPVAFGGMGLVPSTEPDALLGGGAVDVLVVPGTVDVDAALADDALVAEVSRLAAASTVTASVCTGAFLLAAAGLLDGRPWTTHWEDVDLLAERLGPDGARRGVRWVDDGDVVTAAGLSSGLAMALHLVDRLAGRDLAERTARQVDYDWSPEP